MPALCLDTCCFTLGQRITRSTLDVGVTPCPRIGHFAILGYHDTQQGCGRTRALGPLCTARHPEPTSLAIKVTMTNGASHSSHHSWTRRLMAQLVPNARSVSF